MILKHHYYSLRTLYFYCTDLSQQSIDALRRCVQLRRLLVYNTFDSQDFKLDFIEHMNSLESLCLNYSLYFGDFHDDIRFKAKKIRLKFVELACIRLSYNGLRSIAIR